MVRYVLSPTQALPVSRLNAFFKRMVSERAVFSARRAGDPRRNDDVVKAAIDDWTARNLLEVNFGRLPSFWTPHILRLLKPEEDGTATTAREAFRRIAHYLEAGREGDMQIQIVSVDLGEERFVLPANGAGREGPQRMTAETRVIGNQKTLRIYIPKAILLDAYNALNPHILPEIAEKITHEVFQQMALAEREPNVEVPLMNKSNPQSPIAHWWVVAAEIQAMTHVEAFGTQLLPGHKADIEWAKHSRDIEYLLKMAETPYEKTIDSAEQIERQALDEKAYQATVAYSYQMASAAQQALLEIGRSLPPHAERRTQVDMDAYLAQLKARPELARNRVIVVGGGPAGLVGATRLAEAGIQVTLVDRRRVLGGLGTFGIPNRKSQKGLKTSILKFARILLIDKTPVGRLQKAGFFAGRVAPLRIAGIDLNPAEMLLADVIEASNQIQHMTTTLEGFPNVSIFLETDFDHVREARELGIPILLAHGAQDETKLGVPGEDLGNIVTATNEFFLQRNIDWVLAHVNEETRRQLDLAYTGKPHVVRHISRINGGGNVASDAAMAIYDALQAEPLENASIQVDYRGPAWGMSKMSVKYRDELEKAHIPINWLRTMVGFKNEAQQTQGGGVHFVTYQNYEVVGLELDHEGHPIVLEDGNADTSKAWSLPSGLSLRSLGVPLRGYKRDARHQLYSDRDIAEEELTPGVAYVPVTRPVGDRYDERADLVVLALGGKVQSLKGVPMIGNHVDADENSGRVQGEMIWAAGQALTMRGKIGGKYGSIESANRAAKDILQALESQPRVQATDTAPTLPHKQVLGAG